LPYSILGGFGMESTIRAARSIGVNSVAFSTVGIFSAGIPSV
jgi:hypothetical protein